MPNDLGLLPTTTVGSFPKPDYLKKARSAVRKGKASEADLKDLQQKATRECVAMQERVGLDILVDGEFDRGDMATFFAEKLDGMSVSGLVRSYGNRYYRKPIIKSRLQRTRPLTVEMFQFAQELTSKPMKAIFTGPYTMVDWSFDEHYSSRRDAMLAMAEQLHAEAVELEKEGAKFIQIDEPAISTRPEEMDVAIEAMGIVVDGLKATTLTHVCYGDFDKIYPKILELPIDVFDLEFANSEFNLLDRIREVPFTKGVSVGVLDVHSHKVEETAKVEGWIRKAIGVLPIEKVWISPDCGLKTRTEEEAEKKLEVMVAATRAVRASL